MGDVKTRRQEYAEQTRETLVAAGRRRFVEQGYAATSIEQVVRDARVTRGALYHHFTGKDDLFQAVFVQVEQETMAALVGPSGVADPAPDPWQGALAVLERYLDACLQPDYRRVVLEEGPVALGWARWRALDQEHTLDLLEALLGQLMDSGALVRRPTRLLARVVCAAVGEAALALAAGDDPAAQRQEVSDLLRDLLGGLRPAPEPPGRG